MFQKLSAKVPKDPELLKRSHDLDVLERVRDGTIYDVLSHSFMDEFDSNKKYIPLSERRPAILTNLCGVVVEDSISLLFSEGHFPSVDSKDENLRKKLELISKKARLNDVMADAAYKGSVGSVAILLKIIDDNLHFEAKASKFLTPIFDPNDPLQLLKVVEKFKVTGLDLRNAGYTPENGYEIYEDAKSYWFQREFTKDAETWFIPWEAKLPKTSGNASQVNILMAMLPMADATGDKPQEIDPDKTTTHKLGRVPIIWIKNLGCKNEADGYCTFERGIHSVIELDYLISQGSRGVKYNADPIMVIKDDSTDTSHLSKGGNELQLGADGDAKLLELNGTAATAVIDFARALRETALEAMHGNRANADRISAAQSGRATELLYQPLILMADRLRTSYGEHGLLELYRLIVHATKAYPALKVSGEKIGKLNDDLELSLRWNEWFPTGGQDRFYQAQAFQILCTEGIMSRLTATKAIADQYEIEGIETEVGEISKDIKTRQDEQVMLAQATKPQPTNGVKKNV